MRNWADNWFVEGSKAWYIQGEESNCLFEYDFKTNIAKKVIELPNFGKDGFRGYANLFKVEEDIYCLPDNANSIAIVNLRKKKIEEVFIDNIGEVRLSINQYFTYNDSVYLLFSVGLQTILFLDIKKKNIIDSIHIKDKETYNALVMFEKNFYAKSIHGKNFIKIDLETHKETLYKIKNLEDINTIVFDGNYFWFSGNTDNIFKWQLGNSEAELVVNLKDKVQICKNNSKVKFLWKYKKLYMLKNQIIGIPYFANEIICIDKNNGKSRTLTDKSWTNLFDERLNTLSIPQYIRDERFIGFCITKKDRQFEYDVITNEIKPLGLKIDGEVARSILKRKQKESYVLGLNELIQII